MKRFLNYWSLLFLVYTSAAVGYSFGQVGQVIAQTPIDEYSAFIVFVKMVVPFVLGVMAGCEAMTTARDKN